MGSSAFCRPASTTHRPSTRRRSRRPRPPNHCRVCRTPTAGPAGRAGRQRERSRPPSRWKSPASSRSRCGPLPTTVEAQNVQGTQQQVSWCRRMPLRFAGRRMPLRFTRRWCPLVLQAGAVRCSRARPSLLLRAGDREVRLTKYYGACPVPWNITRYLASHGLPSHVPVAHVDSVLPPALPHSISAPRRAPRRAVFAALWRPNQPHLLQASA